MQLRQQWFKRFGLGHGARKAIEQPTLTAQVFHLAFDDGEHKGITHQFATVHHGLSFLAELRASSHLAAQQISGGKMLHSTGFAEHCGLGAFAGAGRAEEEKAGFHRSLGSSNWKDALLRNGSLADQTFVALRDHVGLHLFGGVDCHPHKNQQGGGPKPLEGLHIGGPLDGGGDDRNGA